ncbi:MAG: peptidoglycan amidohydrolase family protein [Anaerovoracaceae bacterium]
MLGCTVSPLAAEEQTSAVSDTTQQEVQTDTSAQSTSTSASSTAAASTTSESATEESAAAASAATSSTSTASSDEYEAPSAITVTGKRVNGTTIRLSWNACTRADYYLVYYVNSKGKAYKRICTTKKRTYTDTAKSSDPGHSLKINANSGYTYMVIARNVTDRGSYNSTDKVYVKRQPARTRLIAVAKAQLGKGYSQSRRTGPKTFDCSGYVWYCYNKSKASTKSFSAYNTNGLYSHLKKYKRSTTNVRKATKGDIVLYGSSTSNTTHAALVYNPSSATVINAANPRKGVCYGKSSWYGKVVAIIHLPDNN